MELLDRFKEMILLPATLVVISAGFLLFTYGLYSFMTAAQKGGNVQEGKDHMLWGVIGMFVMISVYGIIALIANTIGVNPDNPADTSRINDVTSPAVNLFKQQFK